MPGRFDLVIFDCDGVLVDTERLSVRAEADILRGLGWPLTEADIIERFVGRTAAHMHQEIETHLGRVVDWQSEFEDRYEEIFRRELMAIDGIVEVLDGLSIPYCVASSGTHERMAFTLGLTGLSERFAGRIFSASEVAQGKPAPDIFLHAADRMGVPAGSCAVVEDSVSGVRAALAAGMSVFGFAGGVTERTKLALPGVVLFDHMSELPALFAGV
jgi:HAD superfamily hydrolase (TIGR01509 family)